MSDEHFIRLKQIFGQARKLDGDQRLRLLDQECGSDPELRREIEELLRSHDDSEEPFLERPALGEVFSLGRRDLAAGDSVGAYTILEPIGEGGMGVVYLAEQQHPHRTVALKLIRPGLAGPELVRRFEREAEALGQLSHPGIAQIFEAGVSDGVPFIAMERVHGRPLMDHVRASDRDLGSRLQLFLRICDAVQHAHQQGVIHRDLKPGNILVEQTPDGDRPRILDFGVARVTAPNIRASTLQTNLGELIGTIQYMSPEQASGDSRQVDTRSDVYCLGVILFEMLSGSLPYDLSGRMLHDATRVIREEEPTSLSSLDANLRGDLDTIVGKALEKDRERRYGSVGELAADLQRFLRDEPIEARAPSAIYQLKKFARRNRALVIGIGGVLVALAIGFSGTTWKWLEADRSRAAEEKQRIRAERLLEDLRQLARTFIFDFNDRIQHLPGSLDARRLIVSTALTYLDRLAREAPDDPPLLFELALAYGRIGDIQGLPSVPNVGDTSGALKSFEVAQALLARIPDDFAPAERLGRERIIAQVRLGDIHFTQGDSRRAMEQYLLGQAAAEELFKLYQANVQVEECYSTTCQRLGDLFLSLGRTGEALDQLETAREIARRLDDPSAEDHAAVRTRAVAEFKLANVQERAGRHEQALESFLGSLGLFQRVLMAEPESVVWRRDVGTALCRIGRLEALLGRAEDARKHQLEALLMREELAAVDPDDAQARLDLFESLNGVGELDLAVGSLEAAGEIFQRALSLARELSLADPQNYGAGRHHAVALYKLSELHRAHAADQNLAQEAQNEHWKQARTFLEQSRAIFLGFRTRGVLAAADQAVPEELALEIEACTAEIAVDK